MSALRHDTANIRGTAVSPAHSHRLLFMLLLVVGTLLAMSTVAAPVSAAPQTAPASEALAGKEKAKDKGSWDVGWVSEEEYVSTASASGCNDDVCIDVTGSGLTVTNWSTTAFGNVGCIRADYRANNGLLRQSPLICPTSPSDGVYYAVYTPDTRYKDGTRLCNNWAKTSGYPCITVQA